MEVRRYVILVALAGAMLSSLSSCGVARHLPKGSYLLQRNTIKVDKEVPRKERIGAGELDRYVVQSPNKRFLGTNLYASLYAQANPEKNSWWHRFLRRTGEEPVVWDPEKTVRSMTNLETYVTARGFFAGDVAVRVDTVRGRKVKVRYTIHQGPPSRIGKIKYNFRDSMLRDAVMADSAATLLHGGDIFDIDVMDRERGRIALELKDAGYYDFDVGDISFVADSTGAERTIDLEMIVRRNLEGYDAGGVPVYAPHAVYRINEVFVRPDYDPLETAGARLDTLPTHGLNIIYDGRLNMRSKVLRRAIIPRSGELYSNSKVAATSAAMMRLGAFRSVNMIFSPVKGAPGDTTGDRLLDFDIRCVPAQRQSIGVDLEGSTTSNFYGLRATLGYQNRNTFHGAELFDTSLTTGFEFLKSSERKLSYELGATVSLAFPRIVFWGMERSDRIRNPFSTLTLSANWQDRAYYSRTLLGVNWGYSWGIRRFHNLIFRPIDLNLVRMGYIDNSFREQLNNPYLAAAYNDQLIAGLSASYVFNNQPRDLDAGAVVVRLNFETTGNLFSGLAHAFGKPEAGGHYNILGVRFSQYVRGDVAFSQKIVLGEKTSIAYRVQGGAIYSYGNSSSPPFDKLFFAGGANSMRGWAVRTLGPGNQAYVRQNYPAQMGDVKLEANLELRFPMVKSVGGAVFFDVGNIWFMHSRPDEYPDEAVFRFRNFYRQLGFNTGVGIRVDLRFVVLRLDWGIQLHSPNRPTGERWIYDFKWRNTALNFGVGYPF